MSGARVVASGLLLGAAASAGATCWDQAAHRYAVSASLLRAIAQVESSERAAAMNRTHVERTGSYDIGLMQINSRWLPRLAEFGIDEAALIGDPCTNVMVGAWILAGNFSRLGAGWDAVGAYNAACTALKGDDCARARMTYAWRVYRALGRRKPEDVVRSTVPLRSPRLAVINVTSHANATSQ